MTPPTDPEEKKEDRGSKGREDGRKRSFFSGIIGPRGQGQCVKRFQAAGVFRRGEMKIWRRYLSPEKPQPRPYFAGHKSINEKRTQPLLKKMWVERFLLDMAYRFIRNLSRRILKEHWTKYCIIPSMSILTVSNFYLANQSS